MIDAQTTRRHRRDPPWRRRRRRLLRRALLALLAITAAVAMGLVVRTLVTESDQEQVAERFAEAWAEEDYGAMYGMIDSASQEEVGERRFAEAYRNAAATATTIALYPGDASLEPGGVVLPVTASTSVFGDITADLRMVVTGDRVEWSPELVFPGLRPGEELGRETRAPGRARILARDGTVLAAGDTGDRASELGSEASAVTGTIAPAPTEEERDSLLARGFPPDQMVGLTGLERILEREVAGRPGGVLRAGDREIAASEPERAPPVATTIAPGLQQAAVAALDRPGGIAVLDARTGRVRALVGLAATGPQPPGSTFKLITTTAALEAGIVTPSREFPVATAATIDGFPLRNAGGAACGGTFAESFANSCNSVFAPLGVEVGADRLVEAAERYGLNRPPAISSADTSTIPQPDEIDSDLELGATAIGQGKVLMTPLALAAVAQAIARDGRRMEPTLDPSARPEPERVTSRSVADVIEELMVDVVAEGTGDEAAIEGVDVAGKTGTAELGENITEHAWFAAFAPAGNPKLALAVMIANGGAGGEVAAPVAKAVLEAGL